MRTLGFIVGIIGIGAGVWVTFAENDLSGLIGVLSGVAVIALVTFEPEGKIE